MKPGVYWYFGPKFGQAGNPVDWYIVEIVRDETMDCFEFHPSDPHGRFHFGAGWFDAAEREGKFVEVQKPAPPETVRVADWNPYSVSLVAKGDPGCGVGPTMEVVSVSKEFLQQANVGALLLAELHGKEAVVIRLRPEVQTPEKPQ